MQSIYAEKSFIMIYLSKLSALSAELKQEKCSFESESKTEALDAFEEVFNLFIEVLSNYSQMLDKDISQINKSLLAFIEMDKKIGTSWSS